MARASLRGCRVKALSGILNSTTNYVLSQMERGTTMPDAIVQAQQQGFAEADPRHDLDGWDAALKICILWNVLADGTITPADVEREGIATVQPERIARALAHAHRLKLVAHASRDTGSEKAMVRVEEVPLENPLASVTGTGSVLRIETDCMNPILIMQEHPTLIDTAYGVINDLLTISAR